MGEFKGRLVQPPSTSKREIEPKNRMLEKLLAYLSVSTAASLALAACGIAEGSTNPQPQATEPVPLSSPTPDALNQLSNIELFNQFVTNQIETGHQLTTSTVFSSSEGSELKPEQSQSIEQLLNTFVGLAQNQKVLNFSNDGLGVNTNNLGQIMIEDTLVFDFGKKGKAGMFLVSSEEGNKAYYLSNNGETATQLVFSIRYKDGTVEAFFDPKQVETVLKETDPNSIESTNWSGIFMRPEVLGDNPADNFFATTKQMQYEGEGTAFLFDVLSLDQQNLAMFDPGTLDFGFFKAETAAQAEPTEEPTPAPIFGSKVLMSILAPTPVASEAVPIVEPTPTAEPIPTLSPELTGGIEGIPDPKISNPELFDLTKKDAPIPQFVNAMKEAGFEITEEQVLSGLHLDLETSISSPSFITYRTDGGVALIIATFNKQDQKWNWDKAVLGEYWHYQGKILGTYLTRGNMSNSQHKALFSKYFSNGGILALNGQIHSDMKGNLPNYPERTPLDPLALKAYQLAALSNAGGLYTHFFCEPGRFPENVNAANVDDWLIDRFTMLSEAIVSNEIPRPIIIEFNEAFHNNGTWSPAENPLRSKHNNDWITEYFYLGYSTFLNEGLIPNTDFIMAFNEYEMFRDVNKQESVLSKLTKAREEVFNKLQTNDAYREQLTNAGILQANDITIVLGLQDPLKYGNNDDFINQLSAIAEKADPLNVKIILTEVNPKDGQLSKETTQFEFLEALSQLLHANDNLMGILLWNLFTSLEEDPNIGGKLSLFDDQGNPTSLYYAFLKK